MLLGWTHSTHAIRRRIRARDVGGRDGAAAAHDGTSTASCPRVSEDAPFDIEVNIAAQPKVAPRAYFAARQSNPHLAAREGAVDDGEGFGAVGTECTAPQQRYTRSESGARDVD